jgi:hypothetical protein
MPFYAYCLSDEVTDRMIESVAGVAGAGTPQLIRYGAITAVVSQLEGERVGLTRENVFAHERVVGSVLAHTTPLPFRFGTVVGVSQLEGYVNSQREYLLTQLARVRGSVEMSVKVVWNLEDVRREATARDALKGGAPEVESGAEPLGLGAAFMAAKRREILGDEALRSEADRTASWLNGRLGDAVREMEVRVRPTEALVVAAAHMVLRERLEEYQERLRAARLERPDLHFLTSGPWPPYSFIQARS